MKSRYEMMDNFEKILEASLKAVDPSGLGHDEIEAKLYNLVHTMLAEVEENNRLIGYEAGYSDGFSDAENEA